MTAIICYKCGVRFEVPDNWHANRLKDHETFWCPNGHTQSFLAKSEAEKLKEQLESANRRESNLKDQVSRLDNSNRSLKGVITKLRNK